MIMKTQPYYALTILKNPKWIYYEKVIVKLWKKHENKHSIGDMYDPFKKG